MEFFIGQLVESWGRGFGKIIEIISETDVLGIEFNRRNGEKITVYYRYEEALRYFLFYNRDQTEYLNPENDWRDK